MEDEKQSGIKKLNKIYLIGFVVLGLVVLSLLFLPKLIPQSTKTSVEVEDDDGGTANEEQIGSSSYVAFENSYQLDYIVGKKTKERILPGVGRTILEMTETATGENMTGVVLESSVKKDAVDSGYACTFEVDVSNGEKYKVWIRAGVMYEVVYDASLVKRVDSENNVATLNISVVSEDEHEADRGQMINTLSEWAKTRLPGTDIMVNVSTQES